MKTLIVYLGDYILHIVNSAAATAVGFTLHLTVLRVVEFFSRGKFMHLLIGGWWC